MVLCSTVFQLSVVYVLFLVTYGIVKADFLHRLLIQSILLLLIAEQHPG